MTLRETISRPSAGGAVHLPAGWNRYVPASGPPLHWPDASDGAEQATGAPPSLTGSDVRRFARVGHVTPHLALRPRPDASAPVIRQLGFNDRLFVVRKLTSPPGWSLVVTDEGKHGYVNDLKLFLDPPEPNATLHLIQPGESAYTIAKRYFEHADDEENRKIYPPWWNRRTNLRFYINVLVFMNMGEGDRRKGLYKDGKDEWWDETHARAGTYIWVPSIGFAKTLRGQVSDGSITNAIWNAVVELLETVWEWATFGVAFVAGMVHGALECVWDTITGVVDLVETVWELVKALLDDPIGRAKELWNALTLDALRDIAEGWLGDFERKWNAPSNIERGHFRGWVIGYIVAEVALFVFSVGILTATKAGGRAAKLIRLVKSIRPLEKIVEKADAARTALRGKADDIARAVKARRIRKAVDAENARRAARGLAGRFDAAPWDDIHRRAGVEMHREDLWKAGIDPKTVDVPTGRTLNAAGPAELKTAKWGAFEELDLDWYMRSNQLDPMWYAKQGPVEFYEFTIRVDAPTPAVMSKIATQTGAPPRIGPAKFQYYNPAGLGAPTRGRLLGHLHPDGRFVPVPSPATAGAGP